MDKCVRDYLPFWKKMILLLWPDNKVLKLLGMTIIRGISENKNGVITVSIICFYHNKPMDYIDLKFDTKENKK
jgi:hypothetical protein